MQQVVVFVQCFSWGIGDKRDTTDAGITVSEDNPNDQKECKPVEQPSSSKMNPCKYIDRLLKSIKGWIYDYVRYI